MQKVEFTEAYDHVVSKRKHIAYPAGFVGKVPEAHARAAFAAGKAQEAGADTPETGAADAPAEPAAPPANEKPAATGGRSRSKPAEAGTSQPGTITDATITE